MTREEWLDKRRGRMTGTDAAKVFGVAPAAWGSAITVFQEKLGRLPARPETTAMKRGRRRERDVVEMYAEAEQAPVVFDPPYTLRISASNPLIACTLDALREDDGRPVEAKTARIYDAKWGAPGTDQFPLYYALQLIIEMHVTNADVADLPVEFGYGLPREFDETDQGFAVFRLERNRDVEANVIGRLEEFFERHVLADVPPPIDGTADYTRYLVSAFPQTAALVLRATEEQEQRARRLTLVRRDLKVITAEETKLKNEFRADMGEAGLMEGQGFRIRYNKNRDGRKTDWQAVAGELRTSVELAAAAISKPSLTDGERDALTANLREAFPESVAAHTVSTNGARPFNFLPDTEED